MKFARSVLIVAGAGLLTACAPQGNDQKQPDAASSEEPKAFSDGSNPIDPSYLGQWFYSGEKCDPGSEGTPDNRPIVAQLTLFDNHTYVFVVEGFAFSGDFRFEGGKFGDRITLDNALKFTSEGKTLENWSEGEATYACGRIFVRDTGQGA